MQTHPIQTIHLKEFCDALHIPFLVDTNDAPPGNAYTYEDNWSFPVQQNQNNPVATKIVYIVASEDYDIIESINCNVPLHIVIGDGDPHLYEPHQRIFRSGLRYHTLRFRFNIENLVDGATVQLTLRLTKLRDEDVTTLSHERVRAGNLLVYMGLGGWL